MAVTQTSIFGRLYDRLGPSDRITSKAKVWNAALSTVKWGAAPSIGLALASMDYISSMTPSFMDMRPGTIIAGVVGLAIALGVEIPVILGYRKSRLEQSTEAIEVQSLQQSVQSAEKLIASLRSDLAVQGNKRTEQTGLPFRVVETLGQGAQASVDKVQDNLTMEISVLKRPDIMAVATFLGREGAIRFFDAFRHEARNLAAVKHPNVVRGLPHRKLTLRQFELITKKSVDRDALRKILGQDYLAQLEEDFPHLEMELLSGENLGSIIEKIYTLSENEFNGFNVLYLLDKMKQLASALKELRKHEIVHRDLKPDNLIVVKEIDHDGKVREVVKVLDFGIARDVEGRGTRLDKGEINGTPGFISPEVILLEKPTWESDLFSFGAVFWTGLTGEVLPQDEKDLRAFVKEETYSIPNLEETLRINGVRKGTIHRLVWNIDHYLSRTNMNPAEIQDYTEKVREVIQNRLLSGFQAVLNKTLALKKRDRYKDERYQDEKGNIIEVSAHDQLIKDIETLQKEYENYVAWIVDILSRITMIPPSVEPSPTDLVSMRVNIT